MYPTVYVGVMIYIKVILKKGFDKNLSNPEVYF
ncbi:hypothetical protein MTJW_04090 [Moorella thermoacetica]|nr:hypothetical protein MTJW_04090 [Moorella thermoacetica]